MYRFAAWLISFAAVLWLTQAPRAYWQTRDSNYNISISAGVSYQGPGDIVSGFSAWMSCARAYNAAYATGSNPACDIVDTATGVATCTENIGTNGFADLTSLSCAGGTVSVTTFCTVTHAAGCSVTKMYDQVGTFPVTQATLANMPLFTLNALNSLPCPTFSFSSSTQLKTAATLTLAQPLTASMVVKHTFASTSDAIWESNAGNIVMSFGSSANTLNAFAGNAGESATVTDGAFHAIQGVFDDNNSLSALYSDGTNTTAVGVGNLGMSGIFIIGADSANNFFYNGLICELGFNGVSANATQKSNLNGNQHGANGYNF